MSNGTGNDIDAALAEMFGDDSTDVTHADVVQRRVHLRGGDGHRYRIDLSQSLREPRHWSTRIYRLVPLGGEGYVWRSFRLGSHAGGDTARAALGSAWSALLPILQGNDPGFADETGTVTNAP